MDPLFRKTCADFDEGGAQGLLMNHLGVDGAMRVIFDAGDVKIDYDLATEQPRQDTDHLRLDLSSLKGLSMLLPFSKLLH